MAQINFKMKKSIFVLLMGKIFYTLYGVFIFAKISPVGDADAYLIAPIELSIHTLTNNTVLMGTVTAILKKILFLDVFVHLAYSLSSFYFLKVVIEQLKLTKPQEYFLILMLLFPSFGTWTSIIVKEAFSCSLTCVGLVWIINILNKDKLRFPILFNIICVYLALVLRPIVGFSLISLISSLYLYRLPIMNKYLKFIFMVSFISVFTAGAIFLTLSFIKDDFIPMAEYYFDPRFSTTKSGRPLGFWKTAADFYLKAPEGIFIANLGPNLIESINNPLFIPYFFEGLLFILISLYLILINIFYELKRAVINPNFIFTFLFGIVLVLLLNYPFGLFNPGSAIRYRSSYYHIIIILLLYFYSREKKMAN